MDAFLAAELGDLSGSRLAALLRGICADDLMRFATLPDNILISAAPHAGLAIDVALRALGAARRLTGGASSSGPWLPPRADPRQRPLNFAAATSKFSHVHPRCPPGRLWIEELAAGGVSHAGALVVALEDVYLEADRVHALNASARAGCPLVYSFLDRCRASGCLALATPWELDQSRAKRPRLGVGTKPQERISALMAGPVDILSPALRHPADLGVEAGLRIIISSISGSWKACSS